MTTQYRSQPWAGPPVRIIEPAAPGYEGNPIFGGRWDAPIADEAPVWNTPVGLRCYECNEQIAEGDRGAIRGCLIRKDADGYYGTTEPVHFECDMLGIIGCAHGICHCARPVDTQTGGVGINIDGMPRRTAALLLLERINGHRARNNRRPM